MKRTLLLVIALAALPSVAWSQATQDLYQEACDEGELVACTVLGLMFEAGQGVPRDVAVAAALYDNACGRGEAGACTNLGILYEGGSGVGRDPARAADLYEQACDGGGFLGCDNLGLMLLGGQGLVRNFAAAVVLFERACDGGALTACNHLGEMAQSGAGTPQNIVRAVALYGRACGGGEMMGCVALGVSYERGEGVAPDARRAAEYYGQACDGGAMLGCANLGSLNRTGTGVAQDYVVAAELYAQACLGGVTVACTNLGGMYEAGDGVAQDTEQAVLLYQRACEGGAAAACERIGAPVPSITAAAPTPDDPATTAEPLFSRSGRVVDARDEVPLRDALVDIAELGVRIITDETGRVDLTDLPVGEFSMRAQRAGYDDVEGVLRIPASGEFLMLLNRSLTEDLEAPGRILGRVTEVDGSRGVSAVDIVVLTNPPVRAMSDGQGRFTLSGVPPGLVEIEFNRLGYESRTSSMIVQPARTVEVAAEISTRPIPLAPIEVVAVRSRYLEQAGFYQRGRETWGSQFTREEFEAINPVYTSDVFYRVSGVRVQGGQVVSTRRTGFGSGDCVLQIYLDGVAVPDLDIDILPPEHIEAIEVYKGLAVPIQYPSGCGVVLVWTRRG